MTARAIIEQTHLTAIDLVAAFGPLYMIDCIEHGIAPDTSLTDTVDVFVNDGYPENELIAGFAQAVASLTAPNN